MTVDGDIICNDDSLTTTNKSIISAMNEIESSKMRYVNTSTPYSENWTLAQIVEWLATFPGWTTVGRVRFPDNLLPVSSGSWYRCIMGLQNRPYSTYDVAGNLIFMDDDNQVFFGYISGKDEFTLTWKKKVDSDSVGRVIFDCSSGQRGILFENIGSNKMMMYLISGVQDVDNAAKLILYDKTKEKSVFDYYDNNFSFRIYAKTILNGYATMPTSQNTWLIQRDTNQTMVFTTGTNTTGLYAAIRIATKNGSWLCGTIAEDLYMGYVLNSRTTNGVDASFKHHSNGNFTISGNLYAKTSTVSVSDRREKKNIDSLDADFSENFIMNLNPVSYQFISEADKTHYGLVAQDVENTLDKLGKTTQDFAGVVVPNEDTKTYGLRYEEFIAPLIKVVQEQNKKINDLESRLEKLEELLNKTQ